MARCAGVYRHGARGDPGHPFRLRRGADARRCLWTGGGPVGAAPAAARFPRPRGPRRDRRRGRSLRRAAAPDRRHAERGATTPNTRGALRPLRRKRRLAGGAAVDCRTRRRSIAACASRIANLHAGGRSLGCLAGGGGDRAARLRAVGDRSRGRTYGSLARASGDADLFRDLGLPRQRARWAGADGWCRSACGRRRAPRNTGSRRSACGSSGPTRFARAAPR